MQLTERDEDILATLTRRVRVLSVDQAARTWWAGSRHAKTNARRRLGQLAEAGWLDCFREFVQPEVSLSEPLVRWRPGEPQPDFGPIAYALSLRWRERGSLQWFAAATEAAARRFGGYGGRRPRRSELTHDLHLSAVYLQLRQRAPDRAAKWISEAELADRLPRGSGEKLPDAVIEEGDARTVVELGGSSYDAGKLEAFHAYCEAAIMAYEIW